MRLADKREFNARLVGSDAATDLALLKIEADGLPTVPLGVPTGCVGEWCAVGNPYRFDHSVAVGVVSSRAQDLRPVLRRHPDRRRHQQQLRRALVNAAGEAIGISSAVSLQGQGIGFAVPINVAARSSTSFGRRAG